MVLLPAIAITAILIATAILGFGVGNGPSQKQIDQKVTTLLAGIPQHGAILGSPDAPVTLQMFSDLECPTVRLFVESYLPSIIDDWVRSGAMKLEYLSLKTDTVDEHIFFSQEEAALAAGRQNKMWNFALTFVGEQGQHLTNYANDTFLTKIASQVPELNIQRWNRDRKNPSLFKPIALSVHSGHVQGVRYTPSFLMTGFAGTASAQAEIDASLKRDIEVLGSEASGDAPVLRVS